MNAEKKLKILITAPSLDERRNVSGISTVVRQIVERGTADYRHFAAGRRDDERQTAGWLLRQTMLPLRFYRAVRAERADLVHVNTALNPLSIARDYALVRAAKAARRPVVLHLHGGKYLAREFENGALRALAGRMLERADLILVLSEIEKEIIERRRRGLRVEVLENAVAVDEYPPLEKKRGSLVFLGRLHESKGLDEIVAAARALKRENFDFTFRAFGAGERESSFAGEMRRLLGDRFHFGGVLAGAAKRAELAAADVFVLPSRYGEGLPMALLEAMAAGCVVVVSEMASVGAVVRDGINGFTIAPGDASALEAKLKTILSGAHDFSELRENARRTIAAKFNLADYIEKLENFYRLAIAKRN